MACDEGELIFDDMPFSKWRGKVSDEVIYMPEHSGRKAVMEVSFRAEPFCKCILIRKARLWKCLLC